MEGTLFGPIAAAKNVHGSVCGTDLVCDRSILCRPNNHSLEAKP